MKRFDVRCGEEHTRIVKLSDDLHEKDLCHFPPLGTRPDATDSKGVYVVCSPSKTPLHVWNTPRARRGINQRLENHLNGKSTFSRKYLRPKGENLQKGYWYRFLKVRGNRQMALLEAYAIGVLCPAHIGTGYSSSQYFTSMASTSAIGREYAFAQVEK